MTEEELGKIIVDAAFEAGVQHFVYSGLTSAKLATNGEVPCITFDGLSIDFEAVLRFLGG